MNIHIAKIFKRTFNSANNTVHLIKLYSCAGRKNLIVLIIFVINNKGLRTQSDLQPLNSKD